MDQPHDYDTLIAQADAAYRALRLDEALQTYGRAAELEPASYEAALGLARTLTRERRHAEALAATNRLLELAPERWEGYAALGALHFLTDDYEEARQALERAAKLAPSEPEPSLTMAQLLADMGDAAGAQAALERGRVLIAAIPDGALRAEMEALALHVETYVLLAEGRDGEATEVAQRVVGMREANPHAATLAYSNLGILAARAQNLDEAIEYLEQAYALNPFFHRAAGALGRILFVRQRYERAAEVLGHVVANSPEPDGPTRYAYGLSLAKLGRRTEAEEQFRLALTSGGLRGVARGMAAWQMVWQSAWGRYVVIGLLLAALGAWVYWAQPSPQSLTLVAIFLAFFVAQRLVRSRRRKK
jgi:tetratricopeptide (TPR) repeat protein